MKRSEMDELGARSYFRLSASRLSGCGLGLGGLPRLRDNMATVRSCAVRDCVHVDRVTHLCKAEEIDVGRRLECTTFARDNALLRSQLHATIQQKRAISAAVV